MEKYKVHAPKSTKGATLTPEAAGKRLNKIQKATKDALQHVEDLHVYISPGNRKTGAIPSVSLRPVIDCPNCKACSKQCYDLRNCCFYTNVIATRALNAAILQRDFERFFAEIKNFLNTTKSKVFRWHIGGDIQSYKYFCNMVEIAQQYPNIDFLVFTKCFDIVNGWIEEHGTIPANLKVLFSLWPGQETNNPYNLPVTLPVFEGDPIPDNSFLCPGNCLECRNNCRSCWNAKKGDIIIFNAH